MRCGCASAVLLHPPSFYTGIEFWPGSIWPFWGRFPPKYRGSHFCSAESLGRVFCPCAGATLCTVSIAVYICLGPLAMGTSRPFGVAWAYSCGHEGAHEDRVHHDSGDGNKFHEIGPHVCPCSFTSRTFLRRPGQWCLGYEQILAKSALSVFHVECPGYSCWTGDHKCDRICGYGRFERRASTHPGLHRCADISAPPPTLLPNMCLSGILGRKICHIQVRCLWPPAERQRPHSIDGFLDHWWDIWGSDAQFVCAAVCGTSSRTNAVAIPFGLLCYSARILCCFAAPVGAFSLQFLSVALRFCWAWSHLVSPSPRSISGPAEDCWRSLFQNLSKSLFSFCVLGLYLAKTWNHIIDNISISDWWFGPFFSIYWE